MPRYTADPAKVSATFVVLPSDDYELEIGTPRPFEFTTQKGEIQYGVSYPLKVRGGQLDGKTIFYNGQESSEMGRTQHKRFQMAATGFEINEAGEKAFDEKYAGADFDFDPEAKYVGEFFRKEVAGKIIRATLGVTAHKDDPAHPGYQKFVSFQLLT